MGDARDFYVFGDQTFDYTKELRDIVHLNKDPLLIAFFEQTCLALRTEIGNLPCQQQREIARFSTFSELAAFDRVDSLHPSLDQALSCAYQLALFIAYQGTQRSYPTAANSHISGLCTGALAAAAVCSSTSVSNLLPAAVQAVIVAFRTGNRALQVGQSISTGAHKSSCIWSVMCVGMTIEAAQEVIEVFSSNKHLPDTSRLFLSAVSDHGATISGPPPTLLEMQNDPVFARYTAVQLPIKAPYHAPHLYSDDDIEHVLASTSPDPWTLQLTAVPPISSSTGEHIWANGFYSLLRNAVEDILMRPLRWDQLNRRFASIAGSAARSPITVHSISLPADRLSRAIIKQIDRDIPLSAHQICFMPQSSASTPSTTRLQTIGNTSAKDSVPGRPDKSKIAVIGASGRVPDAEDLDAFWTLLYEGRDVHKVVPPRHWDASTHVDPSGKSKNTSATPFGCWLDHPELFDAKFFNISPREAPQIDPAQRLALMTAYEAIEEAGIVPGATPSTQKDRVGVFYGVTSNDWMETNSAQQIDTYFIPGGNRAFIPGRVNYFFNFSGPSYSVDTACSSSLAAIHVACNALWRGEIDTAIAGGTNVLTNPDFTAGLDRGHFLSRTGNCKTFDDGADGYCRGEGVATVILKRIEDALADGDPIQALISGAYTNHSAEAESITRPHVAAQIDIFRKVLNGAGVDPYDVSYVEMHGTGTQAGDGAEMRSVLETFAPETRPKRNEEQELYVGSAKANIGHGEAASGVASLAKLLLMLKHDIIPPHCGIKTKLNHIFPENLEQRRVRIAGKPTAWKRPHNGARRAFLNNFSAAGGNTALLLEDAPLRGFDETEDPRTHHFVALSAKCATSLERNVAAFISFLDNVGTVDLPRLSWTTTARRMHHPHRVMVYGDSIETIKDRLIQASETKMGSTRPKAAPKIMFAFTGQGSAYAGMGKELYESISPFRNDINRFDLTATRLGFPSFRSFFTTSQTDKQEHPPLVTQLATVCLEMALARLWISWGVSPHLVVGHSLGEYAALNIAGAISDSDTIYLVGKRALLLQQHCMLGTHAMLAVKASIIELEKILSGRTLEIACINSPSDVVLCATVERIRDFKQLLAASNIKASVLNIPYAFHSSQVDPILQELENFARGISYQAPMIPVLSPTQARVIHGGDVLGPAYISQHCRKPVDLLGAVHAAQENGLVHGKMTVLEIGPQLIVSPMVKAAIPSAEILPSLRRKTDAWAVISHTLSTLYMSGANILWREVHREFKACQTVMRLPAYNWDLKEFWIQYVNDWSLRKGDPVSMQHAAVQEVPLSSPAHSRTAQLVQHPETTTIHRFVEEVVDEHQGTVIVESDISRADLKSMVQGHKVNGIPLCTPSVYADIALALGDYLQARYWPDLRSHDVVISDMVIEKALIASSRGPQLLRTMLQLDVAGKSTSCRFLTVDASLPFDREAFVKLADSDRNLASRKQNMLTAQSASQELQTGRTYKFNKTMIYKMVGSLAQFDPNYRALEEIVLDSAAMEASSLVDFASIKEEGVFHTNPAYIDALSQSAGFVMNANDQSNLEKEVFVNHGWGAFQLFQKLSPSKSYQTHVSMSEKKGKLWTGDIFVLDGDELVALFEGIALQGVARRLLHYILSTESVAQSGNGEQKLGPKPVQAAGITKVPVVLQKEPSKSPNLFTKGETHSESLPRKESKLKPSEVAIVPQELLSDTKISGPAARQELIHMNGPVSKVTAKALQIISEESGIANEELTDTTILVDVGIDSLLSLMIASRFKDELALEFEASMFNQLDTIKELKAFLARTQGSFQNPRMTSSNVTPAPLESIHNSIENPPTPHSGSQLNEPKPVLADDTELAKSASSNHGAEVFSKVLQIISEETGISVEEVTEDTIFVDAGIDSLLSLMISARLRDEVNLDVPIDGAVFHNCPTVKDLRTYLLPSHDQNEEEVLALSSSTSSGSLVQAGGSETPSSGSVTSEEFSPNDDDVGNSKMAMPTRRATSIILQGRPWMSSKTLFLFPDGAGSASSYTNIPRVHPELAVVGLNCPYVRYPSEMTCSLDELLVCYLDEIRRRQPQGPYNLGGWSAGGILAYRAAQLLIQAGEAVERIVLIDSPVPKGLDRLPRRFYDHCQSIGLFGKALPSPSPLPTSQIYKHFDATIEVLHHYHAKPLPAGYLKSATIIWATESVMDGVHFPKLPPGPDDTEGLRFLTEKRTDFTAAGWQALFPDVAVDVKRTASAHHFSMMQEPHAQELARIISSAIFL